jgi:hypothetical protein
MQRSVQKNKKKQYTAGTEHALHDGRYFTEDIQNCRFSLFREMSDV